MEMETLKPQRFDHTHLMRNRVDLVEDIVEHSDEQIYQQNIGNQEIHGHGYRRYPMACNPISWC